jgi:uncharacterized OB-fold protein
MPLIPTERLSEDDQAQALADLFHRQAMAAQQLLARAAPKGQAGTCSNCGERCLPTAVYCDADCRDDHEARVRARGSAG